MLPSTISMRSNFLARQQFLTSLLGFILFTWCHSIIAIGQQDVTQAGLASQQFVELAIRVVDEADEPIANVRVFPSDSEFVEEQGIREVRTNSEGRVVLTRVPYANGVFKVGAITVGYAIHQSELKISPDGQTPEQKIVMKRGKTIKGSVFHNDGIAPENSIYAVPVWCPSSITPMIQRGVKSDGTFELENIVDGEYRVFVPVPVDKGVFRPMLVLDSVQLSQLAEPLDLKVDYPSRSSMKYISGEVRWLGKALDRDFTLRARASDGSGFDFEFRMKKNSTVFEFGPLPRGKYDISVDDPRVENLHLRGMGSLRSLIGINAPSDQPITVRLRALPQPQIAGTVVDANSGQPIEDFHIQYYVEQEWMQWVELHRELGKFSLYLPAHGKCSMSVWAEGFAVASIEPFDSLKFAEHKFEVKLQPGASLNGVIIDDAGKPVDGAVVQVFSFSGGVAPREFDAFALREGCRKTINGQFEFKNLPIGVETLRVSHPDFEPKTVTAEIRGKKANVEVTLERVKRGDRN